jgi:hypothetical protein
MRTDKDIERVVLQKAIEKLVAENDYLHIQLNKAERRAAKYKALLCKWRNK